MGRSETSKTEEKVFSFIRKHQMLAPGDRVVAGVSGGADSVCLLFVLLAWKKKYGAELSVVHVNHKIRAEAEADALFVKQLCERLEVPFFLREADILKLAGQSGETEEEAGRNFRYQAFAEVAKQLTVESGCSGEAREAGATCKPSVPAVKIAVAHNLNDRSETMLFHLFRGSGVKGLAGIAPVKGDVIRPLLCLERSEIEDYLAAIGQDYCTDATNEEDVHTRNRIRHHILPYAEREIVPGCVRHMGQTADMLSETEDYLERQTREALTHCSEAGKNPAVYLIDCEKFNRFHPVLQKRMLYELSKALSPGAKDISYAHVTALCSLFAQEGNREICLPFGIRGRREYDRVILERLDAADGKTKDIVSAFRVSYEVIDIQDLPGKDEKTILFPKNKYTKWFDYDKIKKSPVLRTRITGDYLMVSDDRGVLHHKSLKDYMVTEKIPKNERDGVPVLAEDSHVLWIVGYRISEYYKISENTKRVLQVQLLTDDSLI